MQYSSMKTALKRDKLIAICYGRHSGALTHSWGGSAKLALLAGSSVTRYHAANPQPIT
jgi:hypothetical protein